MVVIDHAAVAARSRRHARIAAAVLGVALVGAGGVWIARALEPEVAVATKKPSDPLAGRRQAHSPEFVPVESIAPVSDADRPFLDAPAAGAVAYHAGDLARALAEFEAAIARNPQDTEALSNLGQVLVRMGRSAEAIAHFQRAIAIVPDRWAYRFNLARALGLLGRWDEAIASYRDAQRLFPDDYVTTFNLALSLHKKGDEAAAVEQYQKAIELAPGDPSFRMALAISYEKLQKAAEAAAAYAEYLRLSPDAPDADKVRARIAQLTSPNAAPAAGAPPAGASPSAEATTGTLLH